MRKVVALCAIGVVGGAAACSRPQAQSVSPAAPTVAVAKVARGDISRVLGIRLDGPSRLLTVAPHAIEPAIASAPSQVVVQPFVPELAEGDLRVRITSRVVLTADPLGTKLNVALA